MELNTDILRIAIKDWLLKNECYETIGLLMDKDPRFDKYIVDNLMYDVSENSDIQVRLRKGHQNPIKWFKSLPKRLELPTK